MLRVYEQWTRGFTPLAAVAPAGAVSESRVSAICLCALTLPALATHHQALWPDEHVDDLCVDDVLDEGLDDAGNGGPAQGAAKVERVLHARWLAEREDDRCCTTDTPYTQEEA